MKKIVIAVASVAMAFALTGCGGSPKSVAEKFATALAQGNSDVAADCYDGDALRSEARKKLKGKIEELGKEIDDNSLKAETVYECIKPGNKDKGYTIVDGKEILGHATVVVQFVKGKDNDKKSFGMKVDLVKKDNDWFVNFYSPIKDVEKALPQITSRGASYMDYYKGPDFGVKSPEYGKVIKK